MIRIKHIFTLCFCFVFYIKGYAQPLIKVGAKAKLKKSVENIKNEEGFNVDSTLFFFVVPNVCPRCEYAIPQINNSIKAGKNSNIKTVLVIISENKPDAVSAMNSYKENFDKVALLIDDENEYLYINAGRLSVPFIGLFDIDLNLCNVFFMAGNIDFELTKFLKNKQNSYKTNVINSNERLYPQFRKLKYTNILLCC